MESILKLFDIVALLDDSVDNRLQVGQVGTVVEELASNVYEVDFADSQGQTIVICAVEVNKLLKLTHAYSS